jgi:hypothetical protein
MTVREARPEGAIVYWNGAAGTDRQKLIDGLEAIGLGDFAPAKRCISASLKAAVEEYLDDERAGKASRAKRDKNTGESTKRDKSVQSRLNPEKNGFEVIDVTRKEGDNDYVVDFAVKVNEYEQVEISRGYANRDKIQQAYSVYRSTLDGTAIGGCLIKIVTALKGVTLRDNGGIYWLATSQLEQWEQVIKVFESAGSNQVYMVRTVLDGRTVKAVTDALVDEVAKRSDELEAEIRSGKLGEQAIENRKQTALQLHKRVSEYESILGQTMKHLHQVIGIAEMAAASAVAVQEDKSVFDEMFADTV